MKSDLKPRMRPSRVLAKLRAGRLVSCYKLNLDSARASELAALCGFDCIWTCMEHTANDYELIERQINAAKMYDVDVAVRVPRGSYSDYVRPLELDAAGIIVPHVMSAADARQVVRMTRFHPVGRRPVDSGNADGQYCMIPFTDYVKQANEQRFVIIQIEDPEPLEELDEIARVDGIDMIFFGPGDFSHSIGAPGQLKDRRLIEARNRIAEVARKHGKFAGTVDGAGSLQELVKLGYQFICIGADVISITQDCKKILRQFSELKQK
jgi:4-hydroxy-2-oxoheptanedioate aldolase